MPCGQNGNNEAQLTVHARFSLDHVARTPPFKYQPILRLVFFVFRRVFERGPAWVPADFAATADGDVRRLAAYRLAAAYARGYCRAATEVQTLV